jgi:peptide/nickel transport system permease protein
MGLLIALVVPAIVFALAPLAATGDPAALAAGTDAGGQQASPEQIEQARHRLGLDQPLYVQYFTWLGGALHGNLGSSLFRKEAVAQSIASALPVTLSIAAGALLVSVLLALPAGVAAATHPGSGIERLLLLLSAVGVASPNFVIGLFLAKFIAIQLRWLPAIGFVAIDTSPTEWFRHLLLPSLALGLPAAAGLARYVRASMNDVLRRDYIRTAVGKGLPGRLVIWKHALKNALAPVVTVLGLEVRTLLGGAVAIEAVFALPGLGTLSVRAVNQGDYPIIQGVVLLAVAVVVAINIVVDGSYAYLNPKVRVA